LGTSPPAAKTLRPACPRVDPKSAATGTYVDLDKKSRRLIMPVLHVHEIFLSRV